MTQREIKFRAWDENTGKMHFFDLIDLRREQEGSPMAEVFFSDETTHVMQFTGLHDKNGKEIYEGDVVKIPDPLYFKDKEVVGEHRLELWRGGLAQVVAVPFGFHLENINCGTWALYDPEGQHFSFDDLEVIGNIFEHPSLLEAK
jgi:uncharacterized phage protein (TIGR01671 family)